MSRKKELKTKTDIIDELVKVRKERRLTQEELARKMGCAQPSISRVEKHCVSPTLDFIEKMCDVLGVKISIK